MSLNPYHAFDTDPQLEAGGVIVDYGLYRVTLARAGGENKQFKAELEKRTYPYRRLIEMGQMDDRLAESIFIEVFTDNCIRKWEVRDSYETEDWREGLFDPETEEVVEASSDNIKKMLKAKRNLYNDLVAQASSTAIYLKEIREQETGN